MDARLLQAQALDARAAASPSLAEAQALQDAANRLRGAGHRGDAFLRWARLPLYRN